jgi:hypothetical protein
MSDPCIKLTPEEQALVDSLRNAPALRWAERKRNIPYYLVLLFLLMVPVACSLIKPQRDAAHTRFSDCTALMSPDVHNVIKLKVLSAYLPGRPLCRLKTDFFTVDNIFQPGTSQVQMVLPLHASNQYHMDGMTLLIALVPDKDRIPPGAASASAMQALAAISDISTGNIDIPRILALLRQSGEVAGLMAANAETLKHQLQLLPRQNGIPASAVPVPPWLDAFIAFKVLKPKAQARTPAPPPPRSGLNALMNWLRDMGGDF